MVNTCCMPACNFNYCSTLLRPRPTPIYDFLPEEYAHLSDITDRGGLLKLSEFCYSVAAFAVQYYSALTDNDHARIRFLTLSNQREAFIFALKKALPFQNCSFLLQQQCSAGNLNFTAINKSAFTCFAKNELKRINDSKETILEERKKILENCKNFLLTVCRRRHCLKGIHSRSDTNRTGAEGLSFYYPRLLHCLNQMLAVVLLSQHRVSSSKTVKPCAPCSAQCIRHAVSTWSAVFSEAAHSQFSEGERPHLCMDE